MAARSSRTDEATLRRWTLTTTRSPVRRVAACTWAIEADAMGRRSNETKTSLNGQPRSSSSRPADHREGLGWHPVTQESELVDQFLGEDPLAGRDDLAELDVGGPEAFEGGAQATGQPCP